MTTATTIFDADTLTNACQRVMAAVVDAADALPGVVTPPARQLVTSGAEIAWDCEMVFVSAVSIQTGLPESIALPTQAGVDTFPQGGNSTAWTLTVECGIVRAITATPDIIGPADVAPDVSAFLADLTSVSSDTAVLINAAARLGAQGLPIPQHADMLTTQGDMQGVSATFTIELFPWPGL